MAYCSNCGAPLMGAQRFCSSCGFKVPGPSEDKGEQELDRTSRLFAPEKAEDEPGEGEEADREEPAALEDGPKPLVEPSFGFPQEHLADEEPIREMGFIPPCKECGKSGEAVCIFCDAGLCDEHGKKMAIMVNNIASSRTVRACAACAKEKVGKVPAAPVAKEADFLYAIKPYHEWGFVD